MKKVLWVLMSAALLLTTQLVVVTYAEETWQNNKYKWEDKIPDPDNVVKIVGGDINGDLIEDIVAVYNAGSSNTMLALVSSGGGYETASFDILSSDVIGKNELAKVKSLTIEDGAIVAGLDFNIRTLVDELSGVTPAVLKFRYLEDKIKLVELTATGTVDNGRIAHVFYNVQEGQVFYHYLGENEKIGQSVLYYFRNYSRVVAPQIGKTFPVDCDINKWVMVARPQRIKNSAVGNVVMYGFEKWRSDADLSGKYYMAYQNNQIYLLVNVTDDVFRQNFGGDKSLRGDHIEIWFAGRGGGKYQLNLNPGNFGTIAPEAMLWYENQSPVTNRKLKEVEIKSVRTQKGYVVEARLPVSLFHVNNIRELTNFTIVLSDSDAADRQEKIMSSSSLIWSNERSLGEIIWK